jgi:hypothetical protein
MKNLREDTVTTLIRNFQAVVDLFSDSADSADLESFGLFRERRESEGYIWMTLEEGVDQGIQVNLG